MSLAPCPACSRHVRASDAACPFCAAPAVPGFGPARPEPAAGALGSRAQLFLGAVTAAAIATASAAGCSPPPRAIGPAYGSPAPRHAPEADAGAPATDAAAAATPAAPAGAYGAPPSP